MIKCCVWENVCAVRVSVCALQSCLLTELCFCECVLTFARTVCVTGLID